MTFSILALDRGTGAIGCAAATGNLAVGAWVLRAAARSGAVATQGASVSSLWGDDALARLERGEGAEMIVREVTGPDTGRDCRQLAVLDSSGGVAAWTGAKNMDEMGQILGIDYVIAGNWLSSTDVLGAIELAFCNCDQHLGRRLITALEAGVEAGSDARGTFSAAVRVVRPDRPPLDLRVDHADAPVARLRDLYETIDSSNHSDWTQRLPTLEDPYRC